MGNLLFPSLNSTDSRSAQPPKLVDRGTIEGKDVNVYKNPNGSYSLSTAPDFSKTLLYKFMGEAKYVPGSMAQKADGSWSGTVRKTSQRSEISAGQAAAQPAGSEKEGINTLVDDLFGDTFKRTGKIDINIS